MKRSMNQNQIREKLRDMGFYHEELLEQLISLGKLCAYVPGELQVEQGRFLKTIPLVLEGQFRVYKSSEEAREVLLYYLSSRQCCPMSIAAAYQKKISLVNSKTIVPSQVLEVPVTLVDPLMRYESWRKFILHNLIDAYQELIELYT